MEVELRNGYDCYLGPSADSEVAKVDGDLKLDPIADQNEIDNGFVSATFGMPKIRVYIPLNPEKPDGLLKSIEAVEELGLKCLNIRKRLLITGKIERLLPSVTVVGPKEITGF